MGSRDLARLLYPLVLTLFLVIRRADVSADCRLSALVSLYAPEMSRPSWARRASFLRMLRRRRRSDGSWSILNGIFS